MRSAPSMQAPGALIAYSRMAQSLPHSAVVHAARESIRTAATLTQRSRRYTQRFSVLSGAKRSGHGKRANIERRRGSRIIRTKEYLTQEAVDIRSGFPFLAERSGAVTENARISNGGDEERASDANIQSMGGKTTKGREYRAEFSVLAKRSRKTSAIGPDRWSMGGCSGLVYGWL